ncbi:MAG: CRISPR-associated endonuclease Cas2 [Candidatus Goldbacteria bacterium]|nr:CRISPR-associated endonuclease Cas2 [Candidatus Goldiibacteriota bacterium]
MMVLITYDVQTDSEGGARRLRKIAKECENYGQRVQNSVFECLITPDQFVVLRNKLEKIMDKEKDSLRYYFLGRNWHRRVEHIGAKKTYDPEGPMII